MTNCPVCLAVATKDYFFYWWKDREWRIYRCSECTHQFVFPKVSEDLQAEIYSDRYFSASGDWSCQTFRGGYVDAEEDLKREAESVLDMFPLQYRNKCFHESGFARLLDVGCAGGIFLQAAKLAGFDCSGIELNKTMASEAAKKIGADNIRVGRIEDIHLPSDHYDVVTLMDVLEHLPEPREALLKINSWMKNNATLLIRGPLSNSKIAHAKEAVRRFAKIDKLLPGYPLDANCFNTKSLEVLLSQTGFEIYSSYCMQAGFGNLVARKVLEI